MDVVELVRIAVVSCMLAAVVYSLICQEALE